MPPKPYQLKPKSLPIQPHDRAVARRHKYIQTLPCPSSSHNFNRRELVQYSDPPLLVYTISCSSTANPDVRLALSSQRYKPVLVPVRFQISRLGFASSAAIAPSTAGTVADSDGTTAVDCFGFCPGIRARHRDRTGRDNKVSFCVRSVSSLLCVCVCARVTRFQTEGER